MRTAILIALAAAPLACWAADQITPFDAKPGLWETTSTSEMSGMPAMPQIPPETLARMPPEQRARIEAMLKNMGGPHTTTAKACITRESLQKGLDFSRRQECTQKVVSSSASKQQIHVECTTGQGKVKTTGDVTVERLDSEHAKGNVTMQASEGGPQMNMKMSFNSKWLSSDCGDVKPFDGK
ncbi:MAG TPA: DUF3617 domain-containing protein [Bryobacteraceae bacterium]|nr:DUF3617 domain-containing protein [Bryobacteraceae bacterium]